MSAPKPSPPSKAKTVLQVLGPGLITGASDDDPSGIATYSQVGAQFGYGLGWTMLFSFPLMAAIQAVSARIGRVTGLGLAGTMRLHYPRPLLLGVVTLLLIANVINIAADIGAMGAAFHLLVGGPQELFVILFGTASVLLQVFSRYERYVGFLKWLTLSLLAYFATVLVVKVPWADVVRGTLVPALGPNEATSVVAVLGTTISPYLFFWQSQLEAENTREDPDAQPLSEAPHQAETEIRRIRIDTLIGMAASNLVGLFIIITTAATLHASGTTHIGTSAQAAEALRPLAGGFASAVFAAGIIGTGLMAVPVLAGSAAYAVGEVVDWPVGLARAPGEAKAFYGTLAFATLAGAAMTLTPIDPFRALFWTAVINGVVAVPVMAVMMSMARREPIMGKLVLPRPVTFLGWLATSVMAVAVAVMAVSALGVL